VATKLEKKVGTLMAMYISFISIFTISLIFIVLTKLLMLIIVNSMKFKEFNFDFYNTCGYAPVCFSLFYVICTFESNLVIEYIRFNGEPVNSKYLPFLFLIIIQILYHDSPFVGHLAGILTGVIIKNIFIYFAFPSKASFLQFEIKYSYIVHAAKEYINYVDVNSANENDFKEIDKKWCDFPLFKYIIWLVKGRNIQYVDANTEINNESQINVERSL